MRSELAAEVTDPSGVGEARRSSIALAERLRLPPELLESLALVVTELGTNLCRHAAAGGQLLIRPLDDGDRAGIEVLSVDHGPGIEDLARCLRDGFSSVGSMGAGLGTIRRRSTVFDMHSTPGKGTVVLCQLRAGSQASPGQAAGERVLEVGAVCIPKPGEQVCGDSWLWDSGKRQLAVVDGIGHGPLAAEAAGRAVRSLAGSAAGTPALLIADLHEALKGTRGAAAAIATLDPAGGVVRYCGVGNIAGAIVTNERRIQMVSNNGSVGHGDLHTTMFSYRWNPDQMVVMHSDGCSSRWSLGPYPGLVRRHPSLIAGVLYRDFVGGHDDATVVVIKARSGSTAPGPGGG